MVWTIPFDGMDQQSRTADRFDVSVLCCVATEQTNPFKAITAAYSAASYARDCSQVPTNLLVCFHKLTQLRISWVMLIRDLVMM